MWNFCSGWFEFEILPKLTALLENRAKIIEHYAIVF
ncbi:unknown [[Mannheimia] succiniciproducens MBEL55E]|uniref:Uncharacterized protein n=1 Tax=Mannheimia succiniciproducens (strain KCTC 0769BP / MBEL55E) TaxID=221988 RepID=Q65QM0_MANSM|nr:unknown [[Mannheimia] succiniciproducens MBEL55E]